MKQEKKEVEKKTSKFARISFIMSIVSLILVLVSYIYRPTAFPIPAVLISWLSPFLALGAIFLGILGLRKISKNLSLKGKGFCIVSIILGSIIFLLFLSIFLILLYKALVPCSVLWPCPSPPFAEPSWTQEEYEIAKKRTQELGITLEQYMIIDKKSREIFEERYPEWKGKTQPIIGKMDPDFIDVFMYSAYPSPTIRFEITSEGEVKFVSQDLEPATY